MFSAGGKFAYLTATKYVYEYTNDISTLFGGTSTNASTLHISAKVSLVFPTPCEGVLQVNVLWFMLNIFTAGWHFIWGVGSMTWFSGCVINECVMFITSVVVWISVGGIPEPLVQSESTQPQKTE